MGGRNIQLPLRAGKPAGTEEDPAGRRQHADRRRLEEDELLNGGKKTQPKKTSPFRPAELSLKQANSPTTVAASV